VDSLLTGLSEGLAATPVLALLAALAWGIASVVLSPCHLASIPLIVGFVNGGTAPSTGRALRLSLLFAAGVLVSIAVVGAITAAAGRILGDLGMTGNILLIALLLVFGLMLLDVVRVPIPARVSATQRRGYTAALALGLAFGIGLGPCTFAFAAPVFALVFFGAPRGVALGAGLVVAFAVGHCLVLVVAGTLGGRVGAALAAGRRPAVLKRLRQACGVLLMVAAGYTAFTVFVD
jgi:cytochrome c-type biogenesis protein